MYLLSVYFTPFLVFINVFLLPASKNTVISRVLLQIMNLIQFDIYN